MVEDIIIRITLSVIIATLFAIIYCLRYIVLIDRKIESIEEHLDKIVHKTLQEEIKLEKRLLSKKKR